MEEEIDDDSAGQTPGNRTFDAGHVCLVASPYINFTPSKFHRTVKSSPFFESQVFWPKST